MGKWLTAIHHKREPIGQPFPAGDHKAQINRRTQRHNKHKTEQKHKRSTKEVRYRLGTVSKIFYWRA